MDSRWIHCGSLPVIHWISDSNRCLQIVDSKLHNPLAFERLHDDSTCRISVRSCKTYDGVDLTHNERVHLSSNHLSAKHVDFTQFSYWFHRGLPGSPAIWESDWSASGLAIKQFLTWNLSEFESFMKSPRASKPWYPSKITSFVASNWVLLCEQFTMNCMACKSYRLAKIEATNHFFKTT